jgi:hypothetical protein
MADTQVVSKAVAAAVAWQNRSRTVKRWDDLQADGDVLARFVLDLQNEVDALVDQAAHYAMVAGRACGTLIGVKQSLDAGYVDDNGVKVSTETQLTAINTAVTISLDEVYKLEPEARKWSE